MKFNYSPFKSFLLIHPKLNREVFLSRAEVVDGYSRDMFSRMYDAIFSELLDVEMEYKKYYAFEYKTLKSYLYKKYNISREDIEYITKAKAKCPECNLYRKDEFSYGDYGIMTFAFSDTMYDRVCDILTNSNFGDQ